MEIPEQREEIEVLRSIFDDSVLTIQDGDEPCGTVEIHPMLPEPFFVVWKNVESKEEDERRIHVNFLPPMTLYFKLVKSYPTTTGPAFLLACQWLTFEQLRKLCTQLDFIWKEYKPEVVLYRWISFLQEEALGFLKIESTLDITPLISYTSGPNEVQFSPPPREDLSVRPKIRRQTNDQLSTPQRKSARRPTTYSCYKASRSQSKNSSTEHVGEATGTFEAKTIYYPRIENDHDDPNRDSRGVLLPTNEVDLQALILQFDEGRKKIVMDKEWFTCNVCIADKQGYEGMRFHGCNHIYCRECLQSYFTVQIQEGNVRGLNCIEDKCQSQALPHQVRELVGNDLFLRYDRLLLESTLSQMADIVICPLQSCQCSIIVDVDSKLVSCPACQYTFCILCRMTYHGIVPCRLYEEEIELVVEMYFNADDAGKKELERKYGKKEVLFLINERLSQEWVAGNSKKCPSCFASIQKIEGCNKMACTKCNTYFCWLCRTKLSNDTPYNHFHDPLFPKCSGKLHQ